MEVSKPFNRLDYVFKLFVVIALVITAVTLAQDIVIPLLLSAFLAVILLPVVNRLQRKLSLMLSVSIVLIVTFLIFVGAMWIIGDQLSRSEEHTSELQSQSNLVCRLLLE